jgi:hypothetical protein
LEADTTASVFGRELHSDVIEVFGDPNFIGHGAWAPTEPGRDKAAVQHIALLIPFLDVKGVFNLENNGFGRIFNPGKMETDFEGH